VNRTTLERRLARVEAQVRPPQDTRLLEIERWCEAALGCAIDEVDDEELHRVLQLLNEAPDFAHPLLLRACLSRPEDRDPKKPDKPRPVEIGDDGRPRHLCDSDPRRASPGPEWDAWTIWQRRRWGYLTASNDPEAQSLTVWIEEWAANPRRAYRRGVDLRLWLRLLGAELRDMGYLELRRLVDLCRTLDGLALEYPALEVPLEVWWAVLGWSAGGLETVVFAAWRRPARGTPGERQVSRRT
jgi:hypothetical protein